jgi:hypothetical protein
MRRSLRLACILPVTLALAVAAGAALALYLAGQVSGGTTAAQEDAENRLPTAEALIQQWLAEGTVLPALTITPYPTCPPDPPTPTPIPGQQSTYWPVTPAPWPCIPADQPPPDKMPDLSSLFPEREPEECEGCIDLGKPVPYEVPMKVAGKEIHLPVGSTHHMMFVDYPAGTGLLGPTKLDIIERGDSKAVIDSQTGQIIEWNVAPEDEADFGRLILEPLEPAQ